MTPAEGFCLKQDDDGHWYVVPVGKAAEFAAWLDSVDAEDFDPDGYPDGVVEVGGSPGRVVFPSFAIG